MKENKQKCLNKKKTDGGMGLPGPVSGLNDNLEIMGKQLHIQTESTGFPAPRIVTQVFCNGRVVLSRKTDPPSIAGHFGDPSHVRELMHSQHLGIIREIKDKLSQLRNRAAQNSP